MTLAFFGLISILNLSVKFPRTFICSFRSVSLSTIRTKSSAYSNVEIFISHRFTPFAPISNRFFCRSLRKRAKSIGLKRHLCLRPRLYWKKSVKPNLALTHDLTHGFFDFHEFSLNPIFDEFCP